MIQNIINRKNTLKTGAKIMESRNHSKNGAHPKSLTSREIKVLDS